MPGDGGRRRNGESAFSEDRVSVEEDETVLVMEGGDGCRRVHLIPLNCIFKWPKWEIYHIFYN